MHSLLDAFRDETLVISQKMSGPELAKLAMTEMRIILYTADRIPLLLNLYTSKDRIKKALTVTEDAAEKYSDIKLSDLPIYKCHEEDVSGSLNAGVTISSAGCGIYRIQPLSDTEAVMHCYPDSVLAQDLSKGSDVPVTVAVGTSPRFFLTAASKRRSGQTSVPDGTQIIIRGTVSASQRHPEGPFMTYRGLSEVSDYPVMSVESVKIAENGVYHTIITGPKYDESLTVIRAAEELI